MSSTGGRLSIATLAALALAGCRAGEPVSPPDGRGLSPPVYEATGAVTGLTGDYDTERLAVSEVDRNGNGYICLRPRGQQDEPAPGIALVSGGRVFIDDANGRCPEGFQRALLP